MLGLFVYIILYSVLIYLSKKSVSCPKGRSSTIGLNKYSLYSVVFFSLVIGLRYDVGLDWMGYHDLIIGDVPDWSYDRLEPVAKWSMTFIQRSKLPYYVWFIFMAFVQIFFISRTFTNKLLEFLPFGIFCYLAYELSFDMNVVRQGCALSIALFAYSYIPDKDLKRFFVCIVFASLFHKTAIVFLPLYFIGRFNKIAPLRWQIPAFLILQFFGAYIIKWLIGLTGSYWDLLNYGQKIDQLAEHEWEIQSGMGLGILFTNIRRIAIICFSPKLFERYKDKGFAVFYNIFFLGACMYSATMSDMLLERMCRYLSICDIVVSAYFFHYLIKDNKQNSLIGYVLLLGLVVIAAYEVAFGSPWQFINFFSL